MKTRLLVLSIATLCLSAAPASASLFTLNHDAAMLLDEISVSSSTTGPLLVTDVVDTYQLGGPMQGYVGFSTGLYAVGPGPDYWAEMTIGGDTGNVIAAALDLGIATNDLSGFGGYELFLANDNDDIWSVQLYIETTPLGGGLPTVTLSGWTELISHQNTELAINFTGLSDLDNVTDIGFMVGTKFISAIDDTYPSSPDFFHVSVVPVPAAVILGVIGLGVAGWKLRKFT